jgi:hypothetical protein
MTRSVGAATALAALLWLRTADAADAVPVAPAPNPAFAGGPQAPAFVPGFADLMSILIGPRHLKLYYAASERNWELATFELQSLRAGLRRAAQAVPSYQGSSVDQTITAIIGPALQATEAAIATGNPTKFNKAYADLTDACNACHTFLEHPFIVIRVPIAPDTSAYPNQEFKGAPKISQRRPRT